MSYCRFAEGDVYAYECDGGVQFYAADGKTGLDRLCSTFNEAYQYAKALRDTHGLDVPSCAIEALKADALEEAARVCGPDSAVAELAAENAKLREELAKARDPQRIGGQADPSSFVYAIEQLREFRWQHATNDEDAIPYINNVAAAHERENAALRELVRDMHRRLSNANLCAMCPDAEVCCLGLGWDQCTMLDDLEDRMRELGVEVDW